ncbi:nodulation efficiency, NfeD-like protein [Halomonas ramblicola]|uniref:nodulation efficiency, NfeD-like protein n=1 Tax=Halomonas ramblicola TaxID=747349 RepID=UPI0025B448B0|nr:nodulation efficiency, NfeD-like protein [Halomonas ramblicola]MDN3521910.1 nodulation efficiency, NfeD-like protein [Halomonas ramblicola]
MDWNLAYLWLILALLLSAGELGTGGLVLLALGIAAALTAGLAALGLSLPWQLLGMGILSGLLVPLAVMVIRPRFSPRGVAYGTTGTGVEKHRTYTTLKRDFDGATGIKINGDFYRLRVVETGATELPAATLVTFERFDGTTAIVSTATATTNDSSPTHREQ